MTDKGTAYSKAVETQITLSEWGILPESLGWPAWSDELRYEPTAEEQAEAARMYRQGWDRATFESWIETLPDRDLVDMVRAIDTIRRIMKTAHEPLPMPLLASWIDLD